MAKDAQSGAGPNAIKRVASGWVNRIDDEESYGKDVPRVAVKLNTTIGLDGMSEVIEREMTAAIRAYRRFCSGFQLYFTLYGDPLSDDIMSDIQHQAETFAWQQVRKMEAAHV